MAATRITPQDVPPGGDWNIAGVTIDDANGNVLANPPGRRTRVYFHCPAAASADVTIASNGATLRPGRNRFGEVQNPDIEFTVENDEASTDNIYEVVLPSARLNDASDDVTITYAAVAGTVTVAAVVEDI